MSKQAEYASQLNKRAKEIERKKISSLLSANFGDEMHKMQVEEEKFAKEIDELSQTISSECSAFEKVELIDYWDLENGRTNKKR